ncbi:MAG: polysaccharide deacetylase family protein [Deltaproteobacteria bacterium]|nr:polysaccharide deacetylase family protein [Deltaproteobacteria bacterium]
MPKLAILTYHYIRTLENILQRRILGPLRESFEDQVRYIKKQFPVISPSDIDAFFNDKNKFAQGTYVLFTFDDGLAEHVNYVSPFLESEGVEALFFINTDILENLPVVPQILHYAFALYPAQKVFALLEKLLAEFGREGELPIEFHGEIIRNISLVKRFFREQLDHELAKKILLFFYQQTLGKDFQGLFSEIFLTRDDIPALLSAGHQIGGHTRSHIFLGRPTPQGLLKKEIVDSLQKLSAISQTQIRHFSFPYGRPGGGEVDRVLKQEGVDFSYTTEVSLNSPSADLFRLARRSVYEKDTIDEIRAFLSGNHKD